MDNSVWYVCKYCRRVYQHKHQLIEHKKLNHYELLMRDINERKLAKKKQQEEEAKKEAESKECGTSNENGKVEEENHVVPEAAADTPDESIHEGNEVEANVTAVSPDAGKPAVEEKDLPGKEDGEGQAEDERGVERSPNDLYCNELNCDAGSDSEIEIMFDSHRPLASPMKPLSPSSPPDDGIPNKRRRHLEPELLDPVIDVDKYESPISLIEKLEESGNHVYCKNCYKSFLHRSSLRSHRKICHLNEPRSMQELEGRFQIEMRQVETEVGQVKCLSSEHVLVKTPKIRKLTSRRTDSKMYSHWPKRNCTVGPITKKKFYRFHTRGKQFTCSVCRDCDNSVKFKSKTEFVQHVKTQHAPKVNPTARKVFFSGNQRSGWGQFPGGDSIICKLCGQMYPGIEELTCHLKNHSFPISNSD